MYQHAEEIKHKLSKERMKKMQEELKDCTFHPHRITEDKNLKGFNRPNSTGYKREHVISSLERLYPSKEQMNFRVRISEESHKERELKELEECTFRPKFEKSQIDWSKRAEQVPGLRDHIDRLKHHYDEEFRKKTYFDNLGSNYKGELTEVKPFNITESRERHQISTDAKRKITPREFKKTSRQHRSQLTQPVLTPRKNPPTNNQEGSASKANKMPHPKEERKAEERYAKMRIHYAKDKFAEIKVYEDTNPEDLADHFCMKYKLAQPMKKHLYSIIKAKLDTLRPKVDDEPKKLDKSAHPANTVSEEEKHERRVDTEEDKQSFSDEDQHPMMGSENEEFHQTSREIEMDMEDEEEDMRDSSSLPVPQEKSGKKDSRSDED